MNMIMGDCFAALAMTLDVTINDKRETPNYA